MNLVLSFPDKYRLWNSLIQGSTDRIFVASEETAQLGATVPIEVRVPEFSLPIVVQAQVVGRRTRSRRFAAGIYVRIPELELDKCRRFLALRKPGEAEQQARRAPRADREIRVRFLDPASEVECYTRNLSNHGMAVTAPSPLVPGQPVEIEVQLADGTVTINAAVVWISGSGELAGLEFSDLDPAVRARLEPLTADSSPDATAEGNTERGNILIADDDADILNVLTTMLSRSGYTVHQAVDGDAAIEAIRKHRPMLVVMDVLLPGLDGAHVCRAMRADAEMAEMPIVLVSALDEERLHAVADESGASDFMSKPLNLSELIDLVGYYLRV